MLSIDKNTNKNTFVVTARERMLDTNNSLEMELFNFFTNVTYTYPITITYSNVRYEKIEMYLDSELENKTLESGQYRYRIWELDDTNYLLESGMAKVSGTASTYIEMPFNEDSDDFIVY